MRLNPIPFLPIVHPTHQTQTMNTHPPTKKRHNGNRTQGLGVSCHGRGWSAPFSEAVRQRWMMTALVSLLDEEGMAMVRRVASYLESTDNERVEEEDISIWIKRKKNIYIYIETSRMAHKPNLLVGLMRNHFQTYRKIPVLSHLWVLEDGGWMKFWDEISHRFPETSFGLCLMDVKDQTLRFGGFVLRLKRLPKMKDYIPSWELAFVALKTHFWRWWFSFFDTLSRGICKSCPQVVSGISVERDKSVEESEFPVKIWNQLPRDPHIRIWNTKTRFFPVNFLQTLELTIQKI